MHPLFFKMDICTPSPINFSIKPYTSQQVKFGKDGSVKAWHVANEQNRVTSFVFVYFPFFFPSHTNVRKPSFLIDSHISKLTMAAEQAPNENENLEFIANLNEEGMLGLLRWPNSTAFFTPCRGFFNATWIKTTLGSRIWIQPFRNGFQKPPAL